jgi:quercetin dioxygenase-like cupin family protein
MQKIGWQKLGWIGLHGAVIAGALALSSAPAAAQAKGFDVKVLGSIDLSGELPNMEAYGMRMSHVTVAPGGVMPAHSHDGRPEIINVLQGTLTEERNGGPPVDYKAGSILIMKTGVSHALSNRTGEPAVYLATPIFKK